MEKEFRSSQAMRPAWSQSFGLLLGHATRLVAILQDCLVMQPSVWISILQALAPLY